MAERLEYSDNDRGGHTLDVGRLWEIDVDHSLRTLIVYASVDRLRIVDMFCGEWEMAERQAVHLNPTEAQALGEALIAAAGETSWRSNEWRANTDRADPEPELAARMAARCGRIDAETAADREPAG